jgi:RNA polymerase primary sigma factor
MNIEPRKVRWMLRVSWQPLSLERPVGEDDDSELGYFIENDSLPTPSQVAFDNLLRAKIEELLNTLTPREARILRLRFGLQNGRCHTLEEVGQKFGLTRERIRQIEGRALRRLRHPRRSRQLRDYMS